MGALILTIGLLGLGGGSAAMLMIRNLYYICQPNEVLIFAGGEHKTSRRKVGYRLVKGGSSLRVPLMERAMRMDLTNMIIDLKVFNAYSKGGIPLNVDGVANIKIAGEEPAIHNAIERLLGKSRKEIEAIAKETLEGNLRGVLASLTPEQVNEDKIAFAKSLLEEAEDDLEKLGLVLDTLKIQNISDDVRYLDSIGRKQQAELQRDARIAEAKAKAESEIQTAENEKITAVRRLERDLGISTADAERRIQDAMTKRAAVVAETEAKIAADLVRIQAEIPVQQERIKQVRQQLKADVVAPAEANCKRAIAQARGEAAQIVEDGKAQAEGTRSLAESWKAAGDNARDIFLMQKLDTLMKTLTSTVPEISVQNVTIVDTEQGGTAAKAASFVEQLRQTSGIDLASAVNQLGNGIGSGAKALSPSRNGVATLSGPQKTSPTASPSSSSMDESLFPQWAEDHPFVETDEVEDVGTVATASAEIDPGLRATIQAMLDRLALANPSPDQVNILVHQALQSQPELKRRLNRTLQAGGSAALNTLLQHPFITISSHMVEAWLANE